MYKLILLVLIGFVLSTQSQAQTGAVRIEFEAELDSDIYNVLPATEKGVLIFFETNDFADEDNKIWFFSLHDRLLNQVWLKEVPIIEDVTYQAYQLAEDKIYLFFLESEKAKTSAENFQVITFDIKQDTFYHVKGSMPAKSTPGDFIVYDNTAIIGMNLKKDDAEVYFVDLYTGYISKSIINIEEQNQIESISIDPSSASVNIICSNYINRRQNGLNVFSYTIAGELIEVGQIQAVIPGKYLNTARVYYPAPHEFIVIGTYNNYQGRIPGADEFDEIEAAGFFITRFANGQQEYINYYNFLEFKNLQTGLTGREYYKLQKKMQKENNEYSINYQLLIHDIVKQGDDYIFVAESYYPEFRTVSDVTYDYWGRPIPHNYTVFDGYMFINAIVAGFNAEGEMVWDNSLEIYNIITYELGKKVNCLFDEGYMVMYYNESGQVTYKIIDKDDIVEGLNHTKLAIAHSGDKISESGYDNIIPWYDNYFLCYGYQRIRNNALTGMPRRTVFYLNKIVLE